MESPVTLFCCSPTQPLLPAKVSTPLRLNGNQISISGSCGQVSGNLGIVHNFNCCAISVLTWGLVILHSAFMKSYECKAQYRYGGRDGGFSQQYLIPIYSDFVFANGWNSVKW